MKVVVHKEEESVIPKLRFREFEGEWAVKKLDALADVIDCKHRTPPYVENGVPVISPGTIKWGEIDLVTPIKRVTEDEYELLMDHCSPECGDMVFSRNQSIGVASIILKKEKFVLGQDTVLIQARNADPFYLYFRIQTHHVQSLITRLSGGSTFSRINLGEIRKLKVKVTNSLPEQQKIAAFLTAVDTKLQALKKKKALLEQYKKGVIQKIFSQELRFKDKHGNPFPDWEEKELAQLLNYEQPTKYLVESTEYSDSYSIPVLTAGKTFILGYTNEKNGVFKEGLPVILFDDFTTATQFVNFPFKAKSSAMKILIAKKDVNIKFIFEAMQLIKFETGGHGRHWISIFSQLSIMVPSLPEQTKIASFLSAIDQKIDKVGTQIQQMEQWKKGLLQKMFI